MAMQGKVCEATDNVFGFDRAVPLTAGELADFYKKGFRFCIRYVSRTDSSRQNNLERGLADLSKEETKLILDAGLSLMVVQHVAATGWVPTEPLGKTYGANAARYTQMAGIPEGITLWLDLEDIPQGTNHSDIVAYCNAWFQEVETKGYIPGVYVGFNVWLSPSELYFDLRCKHYWRAPGNIPDIARRGYQMEQHVVTLPGGAPLDKNVVRADNLGTRCIWLAPVKSGPAK